MTIHRLINILLITSILAMMAAAQVLLDGPTDHDAAQAQAMSLQDARRAASADMRMAKARKAAGVEL